MDSSILNFDLPRDRLKIIKVIGVGGGGGNAVTHMYHEGIQDVSFLLCNTDKQALERSDVPDQLVLGEAITEGLGAGNDPKKARDAARASEADIRKKLSDGTKMVFVTAGMGGGTGTGAAPVIAGYARDMGILTVGIVTIPFEFEGEPKILQALYGVEAIRKNVDALLVINNERLLDIYAEEDVETAFAKADDTLTVAARSIAEIITVPGKINIDFADVNATLRNGGVALMSNGYGEGEGRFHIAAEEALNSPLLNNNNVFKAKRILFNIFYSEEAKLLTGEMKEVRNFMSGFDTSKIKVIWGLSEDNTLGKKVKMTILATGFGVNDIPQMDMISEENKEEEDGLTEEEKEQLMNQYYERPSKKDAYRYKIIVLSTDEMDDDVLINLLEDNPTFKRDAKFVSRLREKAFNEKHPSVSDHSTVASRNGDKNAPSGGEIVYF
ncbi:MAG: cell division protein FtsZ [Tannerellaceae bacterium]|jgi:cell division protein FtsZ|nr:cell division protein FtsZ [Tannerellaceae bacterium]